VAAGEGDDIDGVEAETLELGDDGGKGVVGGRNLKV
jgi:hypothetical protein